MKNDKYSVVVNSISKCYKMYSGPKQKLLDLVLPKGAGKDFYALKDISFKVEKGDVVGLVGLNGSGKSTLSNILGGVSIPTSGSIEIKGEASLISIGLGLNGFLTGIENIEIKSIMMGYTKSEIENITQDIIDFADIGDFINQPIRTYSSGMRSRLGFAIAAYTNPDILVIDEALSVGDPTFTQKCLDKMNEFKESGKTIFFVSHSISQIKEFCNKALWLEYGVLKQYGTVEEVLPNYAEYINYINSLSSSELKEYKNEVLKTQEHALLKQFKFIDPKFKKVKPRGKIFKNVCLVNRHKDVKLIQYNIDVLTAVFGFLPSLFRKQFLLAFIILCIQSLNIFIINFPYSVFINFLLTFICGIFTGRLYTNYLIENKGYMDINIWRQTNGLDDLELSIFNSIIKKKISKKALLNKVSIITSLMFIPFTSMAAYAFDYANKNQMTNEVIETVKLNKRVAIIISNKNSEGKEVLHSLAVLEDGETNKSFKITSYPGEIQVDTNNGYYEQLNNLIDLDNIEDSKELLVKNLNEEFSDCIVINADKYGINLEKFNELNSIYEYIISDFLKSDERSINDKKNKLEFSNGTINSTMIDSFYRNFKSVNQIYLSEKKYYEALLIDVLSEEILEKTDSLHLRDYKIFVFNSSDIESVGLVKDLREKYELILNEEIEDEQNEESSINNSQINNPGASIINPSTPGIPDTEPTLPPETNEPPVTEPPVTEPPVTEPPVTEPPVTEPPVTEPPVTEPPVTEPPNTDNDLEVEPLIRE